MIRLLLHSLQSPINVGAVLRVAETFGAAVDVLDTHALFEDPEKRSWLSDFSCGAYARRAYRLVERPDAGSGRLVATCLLAEAESLPQFAFRAGDVVAIGNEYDGLPPAFIAGADVRLTIPMPPTFTPKPPSIRPISADRALFEAEAGDPVLSSAMSAGIICYAAFVAMKAEGRPPLRDPASS